MTLRIFKHQNAEDEQSPEFRYLLSVCVSHARQVFGDVDLRTFRRSTVTPDEPFDFVQARSSDFTQGEPFDFVQGRSLDFAQDEPFDFVHDRSSDFAQGEPFEPLPSAAKYVLVLGRENVWLTVQTLRRMKEAIDGGADCVVPVRVTDLPLNGHEPLYTARDYELLERTLMDAGQPVQHDIPAPDVPIALLSRAVFQALAEQFTLSRLLVEPTLLADQSALVLRRAGCFHQFADYYGEARADLLPYLPATAEDVLEIGCGRGYTGKLIQERLGCRVTGVEKHPEVAAQASRHLWRVIVGDVLTVDLDGQYDAIVASELFEHLSDPDAFLLQMKPLLKLDARIVLSVPNVGHYSIVEDLLAGRWDYVPAGLLCYTHLRFFTRQTLVDWMSRLGFRCTVIPQTTDLPDRFKRMPSGFECDLESLRTKGFYVVLRL